MAWNGSDGGKTGERPKGLRRDETLPSAEGSKAVRNRSVLAIGLVAVALAASVVWWFFGGKESPPAVQARPVRQPEPTNRPAVVTPAVPEAVESDEDPVLRARREKLSKMTAKERGEFLRREVIEKPIDFTPRTNQLFNTGVEQVLSWIFTSRLGDTPPPLPHISPREKAHFAEILLNRVEVEEGDSEARAFAKESVQQAKDELKAFIKEGGTPEEFLEYYHGQLMSACQEWRMTQKEIFRTIREDPGVAKEYIRDVNARLAEKGIKPVTVPPGLLLKYGIDPEDN